MTNWGGDPVKNQEVEGKKNRQKGDGEISRLGGKFDQWHQEKGMI